MGFGRKKKGKVEDSLGSVSEPLPIGMEGASVEKESVKKKDGGVVDEELKRLREEVKPLFDEWSKRYDQFQFLDTNSLVCGLLFGVYSELVKVREELEVHRVKLEELVSVVSEEGEE